MRVFVNALLFVAAFVLAASTLSFAANPRHLLHSLYKEQGRHDEAKEVLRNVNPFNFLSPYNNPVGAVNGGGGCAACTLLVGVFEQVLQLQNNNTAVIQNLLCTPMHKVERDICNDALKELLPIIQTYRNEGLTADAACHSLGSCKTDPGQPTCHLFPTKPNANRVHELVASIDGARFRERHQDTLFKDIRAFNICTILPEVCKMEDHLPAFDSDGDTFSYKTSKTLRGTYWRGEDCNDLDNKIHVGRASSDKIFDENCNGISGVDSSGAPYEEKFCHGTGEMGVAILGDSASAHFSLCPYYLEASKFSYDTYKGILRSVEDELDWPMLSWSTGHMNNSQFYPSYWQNVEPTNSIYKYLKKTNLCNNNDYQNLGVNGARASKMLDFAKILGRVNSAAGGGVQQKPLMEIIAVIGNDVCNSRDTIASMTTPEEFYNSILEAVVYSDSVLAPGSVQVLVGLADGRVLYEYMHNRIHPIGSTNKDVTYTALYDYLNCLQISPCAGWMNSNDTIRNRTTEHANLLSQQLLKVQKDVQGTLKNSRVEVVLNWIEALKNETRYPHYELIEPSDGFHPSGLGNTILAEYMFDKFKTMGFWPKPNPNNGAIMEKFPNILNQGL